MSIDVKAPSSTRSRRRAGRFGCLFALVLAASALSASATSAAIPFGTYGSGAGQTIMSQGKRIGLAVDASTGHVYVPDSGNNRIDVFESDGDFLMAFGWGVADGSTNALQTCTATCFSGIAGAGSGQLKSPQSIAVDNDPTSPAYRNVYVVDANLRIQRFTPSGEFVLKFGAGQIEADSDPIAVGPGGIVHTAPGFSIQVDRFSPSGLLLGSSALPGTSRVSSLAVDVGGDVYITRTDGVAIEKLETSEPQATLLDTITSDARFITLDPAGNLYAAEVEGVRIITKYGPDGQALKRFGYGAITFPLLGLAYFHTATGDVFGAEENVNSTTPGFGNQVIQLTLPPPGPLACCATATSVGNAKATIEGTINPEGKETKYHFEYVDDKSFEEEGGFASPATKSTSEVTIAADVSRHTVSAAANVVPSTIYHFRLVAENEEGETISDPVEFTSLPPLEIGDTWSTEVGTDAAHLHAEVNPLGIETTAYLQYVDDESFKASGFAEAIDIPDVSGGASSVSLGSGEAFKTLTAFIYPLVPGTTYHYRVVAADPFVTVFGEPRTLTVFPLPTAPSEACPNQGFRVAASANLPDCRAFELVTPLDKGNGDIRPNPAFSNYPASLEQGSDDGNRFSFSSSTSFGNALSDPYTSQYVAQRDPQAGWATHPISPPREPKSISGSANTYVNVQYKYFSPDLSASWLLQDADPPLSSCAVAGFMNLYRRDDSSGKYQALTTAKPQNEVPYNYFPELQGLSADRTHEVFAANAKLTKDASTATRPGEARAIYQVYEHISGGKGCGELRLVSVLPNGKPSPLNSSAGGNEESSWGESRFSNVQNAISDDGSRIFWSTVNARGSPGALYVRIDGKETVEIAPEPARFWAASANGSKAIFQTKPGSPEKLGDLYEFDVDKKDKQLIAKEAYGVAAASEDASHVYFASREALGGEGQVGKPNLYLHEAGGPTKFIGTLAAGDVQSTLRFNGLAVVAAAEPGKRSARTTADGSHLAFTSHASLTGYDNKDAATGLPSSEVYLYDAGTAKLACISCNPTGARPSGRKFPGGVDTQIAAQMPPPENQFVTPRTLTTDGSHLFFQSYEALVPRDTNGKEDVYGWQRATDANGCEEAGAELFVGSSGGCLSLISSGKGPEDSQLVDMTPNGSDVFIRTASSLLPQDYGLIDIYDAHQGGGYPAPPTNPPVCEGEACQTPPSPPNDPTPASSTFEGAGNVSEKPAKKKQKKAKKKHAKKHKKAKQAGKQRANSNGRAGR